MMNSSSQKEVLMQEMDGSYQFVEVIPRQQAIKLLSVERGRSPVHPLNATLISAGVPIWGLKNGWPSTHRINWLNSEL